MACCYRCKISAYKCHSSLIFHISSCFSSFPLLSLFFLHNRLHSAWAREGIFGEAFGIIVRIKRKKFQGGQLYNLYCISPASLIESCSFWYGLKDLFSPHKLDDKVATSDTRDVDLPKAVIGGSGVNRLTQDSTINSLSNN